MAVDELKLLVNRLRRLEEAEDKDENKIDELRDKIEEILSESNVKVIVRCSYDREVRMDGFDDYEWIIDRMVDDSTLTQEDILVGDIKNNIDCYVSWDDINVTIEDENGNELDSFC